MAIIVDLTGRRLPSPLQSKMHSRISLRRTGPKLRIHANSVRFVAPNMAIEVYSIGLRSNTNTRSELIRSNQSDIINGASDNFVNFGVPIKFVQTVCESSASGPERSWLRRALLPMGAAAALLSLTACASQNGANAKPMPWYERTPVSASPPR
jgi:hypothetical protein